MGLSGGRGTPNLTTMNTKTQPNPTELPATIKLGIDAHAKWFYVAAGIPFFIPSCTRPAARPGIEGVRWFHLWISNHFGSTIKQP